MRDAARLRSSLDKVFHQASVWNATLRIRCSTGLRVAQHVGSFFERSPTDVDLPVVPPTASLLALLSHAGSPLTEREPSSIQVAILHTTRAGERRVRVLNLRLGVTSLIGNVFRYADPDAVVGILAKEGVGRMESRTLPEVRDEMQRRAVKILTSYRRNCALGAPHGQVRAPRSLLVPGLSTAVTRADHCRLLVRRTRSSCSRRALRSCRSSSSRCSSLSRSSRRPSRPTSVSSTGGSSRRRRRVRS